MKKNLFNYKTFVLTLLWLITADVCLAQISVQKLRCESLENPLAIDNTQPRLSWQISSQQRGVMQTAWQVLVASSPEKLTEKDADLWNSGKVNTSESLHNPYAGKTLKAREKCFWKVKVWTNKGESAWSETANWTVGLLYYKAWNGRWIGFDRHFPWDNEEEQKLSARYFRKEFEVKKQIKSATAYIMGLGLYEFYVNGQKIGNQVLAPAPTDYQENIQYNAFDITSNMNQGKQTIGVILGNGRYYAMRQAKPYKVKTFGFPKLLMQIHVQYTDGTSETIKTDESWKGTANGPILANNEYDGEIYDARKEFIGWAQAGFNDKEWLKAEYVQEPEGKFEAQKIAPMKVMQDIYPVSITPKGNGRYLIDFGQNFSGWMKISVQGTIGDTIKMRFAESLQSNGELFTTNLRDAKVTDTYILNGKGKEVWEPKFVYHGFRYAEVSGFKGQPSKESFVGRFVYDDMATTGTFQSSNALLNQIFKNSWWGIASNYKGMPIDCPQRNERQPWLGDRTVGAYGESFLFDNATFYTKWLDDIRYAQKEDGAIPDVAPAFWRYYSDNVSWPATLTLVTEMLYRQTADVKVLEQNYPAIKKWLSYMKDRYMNDKGIITKDSYGDWCEPPLTAEDGRGVNADQKHPSALISTAYYYHLLTIMTKFSVLTGNTQDSLYFRQEVAKMKKAFNQEFYKNGYYGANKLTDNLLPLAFGIAEGEQRKQVIAQVVDIIENKNKGHLSTGVVGTQWLMRTLTQIGRNDLAFKIATNTTYPSWGYMLENGATTIWELWNGNTAAPKMNSQNHVMMLGDLLIWYYESLAGISSDTQQTGFKKIIMKPEEINGLNWVNASYQSPYGEVKSYWKKEKSSFSWQITIPANSSALVYIPVKDKQEVKEGNQKINDSSNIKYIKTEGGKAIYEVLSGSYHFKVN
ncbi:glycoside hydrolase family 78 protein [Pedobacter puniceum]|uniref:alpha-L-rhamnosidase n=1 Tax=Pedobacter puniceum TaxID=2666136 RepID=A0A7K0FMF3_9SPHI|nr:glycoside hydrolase family 78 protein [Pedobacter puniceum]MRX46197.1 Bacterial alpha-L-rhamnosidase [Pedobacter puniceum]